MTAPRLLHIEVVYALPEEQVLVSLEVEEGTTAAQAVERSGIAQKLPDREVAAAPIGIFGRVVAPGAPLRDGDRIEIYRPLQADPKHARRTRARRTR